MIISQKALLTKLKSWRRQKKKIVFTNGCFDIFHIGHLNMLEKASKLGHVLIVGVNSDRSVKALKGKGRPIIPCAERAALIDAIRHVDFVVKFDLVNVEGLVKKIAPDVLVKAGTYRKREDVKGHQYADTVKIYPFFKGKSTTKVIKSIVRSNK